MFGYYWESWDILVFINGDSLFYKFILVNLLLKYIWRLKLINLEGKEFKFLK